MTTKFYEYAHGQMAAAGFCILSSTWAWRLRPDLWSTAQACAGDYRRTTVEGAHRRRATLADGGDVVVLARSLDALEAAQRARKAARTRFLTYGARQGAADPLGYVRARRALRKAVAAAHEASSVQEDLASMGGVSAVWLPISNRASRSTLRSMIAN